MVQAFLSTLAVRTQPVQILQIMIVSFIRAKHIVKTVSPAALSVQFNPDVYSVNEGEQVVFMVELSSPADREVTVQFATVDGSAMGTS